MKIRIVSTQKFKKQLIKICKRKPQVLSLLEKALMLLVQNEFHSKSLKIHKLKGELKDKYAFSLTYELRVVFKNDKNEILLTNIGTHDEVY